MITDIILYLTLIGLTTCDAFNIQFNDCIYLVPIILFLYSLNKFDILYYIKVKKATLCFIITDVMIHLISMMVYYIDFSLYKEHIENYLFKVVCLIVLSILNIVLYKKSQYNMEMIELKKHCSSIMENCQSMLNINYLEICDEESDSLEQMKAFLLKRLSIITYIMLTTYGIVVMGIGVMIFADIKFNYLLLTLYVIIIGIDLMLHNILCKDTIFEDNKVNNIGKLAIVIGSLVFVAPNVIFLKKGIYIFSIILGTLIMSIELGIIKKVSLCFSEQLVKIKEKL